MAKSATNKGYVGIDYIINDEEARAKMQAFFSFMLKQINTVTKAWEQADKQFSKEPPQRKAPKPPDHGPEINAAEQAAKRIEEVDKRQAAIRESLSHKTRDDLVKDRYELETAHKKVSQAMIEETDKEAKAEIKAQLSVLTERKRIVSQMAAEKAPKLQDAVAHGVKEGGHGGGGLGVGIGFGLIEQGAEKLKEFYEEGEKATRITGDLKVALAQAGTPAHEMGEKLEEIEKATEKTSQKYAANEEQLKAATASYGLMGGKMTDVGKTQELILGLAKRSGDTSEAGLKTAAKQLAMATDPEVEKSLAKQGIVFDKNMNAQQRLEVIQNKVSGSLKQMAVNADGPIGRMAKLDNAMEKVKVTAGLAIMDVMQPLMPVITMVTDLISGLIRFLVDNKEEVLAFALVIGLVTAAMSEAAIVEEIVAAKTWLVTTATTALNTIMALNPVVLVVLAIAALIAILVLAYKHCEGFRHIVDTVWEVIKKLVGIIWEWLKPVLEKVWDIMKAAGAWIAKIFVAAWQALIVQIDWVVNAVKTVWGWLSKTFDSIAGWVNKSSFLKAAFAGLIEPIKALVGWIKDAVSWVGKIFSQADEAATKSEQPHQEGGEESGGTNASAAVAFAKNLHANATEEDTSTPEGKDAERLRKEQEKAEKEKEKEKHKGATEAKQARAKEAKEAKDALQAEIDARDTQYNVDLTNLETQLTNKEITENQYALKKAQREQQYNSELLAIAQAHGTKYLEQASKYTLAIAKAKQDGNKANFEIEKDELDKQYELSLQGAKYKEQIQEAHLTELRALYELEKKYGLDSVATLTEIKKAEAIGGNSKGKDQEKADEKERKARLNMAKDIKDEEERNEAIENINDTFDKKKAQRAFELQQIDDAADPAKLIDNETNYHAAVESAEEAHQERLKDIRAKGLDRQLKSIEDFSGKLLDSIEKGNAAQFLAQQVGLDTNYKTLLRSKALEVAVYIQSEFAKTASAKVGLLQRLAMTAQAIAADVGKAAASVGTAIASAWEWFTALGPWGWAAAGAMTGLIIAEWGNIKKMFFAEGAIFNSPHAFSMSGGIGILGEAGPEVAAPLHALPNLLMPMMLPMMQAMMLNPQGGGISSGLQSSINELKDVMNRPRYMMMDMRKNLLAQEQERNDIDGRRAEG